MYIYGNMLVCTLKKTLVASIALSRGRVRTCNCIVYVSWTAHMTPPVFIFVFFIILLLPPRIRRRRLMDGHFLLRCSTMGVQSRRLSDAKCLWYDGTYIGSNAHTPDFCFGPLPDWWGCATYENGALTGTWYVISPLKTDARIYTFNNFKLHRALQ
jgi:hypothetical protein